MPLIISVPHGGALVPQDIPNRDFGSYKKDRETVLMLKEIVAAFEKRNLRPYVVQMNVHRRKIDVNRGTKEGAQHDDMLKLHRRYHEYLMKVRGEVSKKYKGGLLVDLHGQNYRPNFIEIGYSLSMEDINRLEKLSLDYLRKESSFGALIDKGVKPLEIVYGKHSLGALIAKSSYKVTPSADYPSIDEKHFNGVYILHRHVVTKKEGITGVNLELCFRGVRDTEKNRARFALAFSKATVNFLEHNYGVKLPWKKTS